MKNSEKGGSPDVQSQKEEATNRQGHHDRLVDEGNYVADAIMQGEAIALSGRHTKIIKAQQHVSSKGADQVTNQFMHLPPHMAS
eukprot:23382-Ditylum_brightwellii.AAC.1